MNDIIYESAIAFFSQLAFLWARTVNIRYTALGNIKKVMISGGIIHILWLIGIAIGANGAYKVIVDHQLEYIPVLICSLTGSLIGCYIGLIRNKKNTKSCK